MIGWVVFCLLVLGVLALDLFVIRRNGRAIRVGEALAWCAVWIGLALAFNAGVWITRGPKAGLEFLTAYLIEESLSVDNLFVFMLLFAHFSVPEQLRHRVLFWGILGALITRGIFILAGVGLIRRFHWIIYIFGALLVYSGIKLMRQGDEEIHPERNPVLRLFRRWVPVTDDYVGDKFWVRRPGLYATPLVVVLLVVETTDVLFAVDSIPAVLAITLNAFIVYTSNVFAIMGLRSMYFAVAGMMDLFEYLHYGLSLVLIFIGGKMLASHYYTVPTHVALAVVLGLLVISVVASVAFPNKQKA